jgi:hypothetical protein
MKMIFLVPTCFLAIEAMAQTPETTTKSHKQTAVWDRVHTHALSGDRILFKGVELLVENLTCPDVTVPEGIRAKALMNTFLRRAGHFECDVVLLPDNRLRGSCSVAERRGLKGLSIAGGMVKSGLCHSGDRTKGIGA